METAYVILRNRLVVSVCLENDIAKTAMNKLRESDRNIYNKKFGLTNHPGFFERLFKARPYNEHIFWWIQETAIMTEQEKQ
jgi:hypothetical protein